MEPTLLIGDHIMVNKIRYGLRMPDSLFGLTPLAGEIPYGHYLVHFASVHRGDVVVFVFPPDPTKDFIKRVIGVRRRHRAGEEWPGVPQRRADARSARAFRGRVRASARNTRRATTMAR